jgi:hypothetical protein
MPAARAGHRSRLEGRLMTIVMANFGALSLRPVAVTVTLEAVALGIAPLRDLLGLTVLSPRTWAVALSLATVPLVLTQAVRMWRDRETAPAPGRGAVPTSAGTR